MVQRAKPILPDSVLGELLTSADLKTAFSQNGLFDQLKKALAERMLKAELEHHLSEDETGNVHNGFGHKTVQSPVNAPPRPLRSSGQAVQAVKGGDDGGISRRDLPAFEFQPVKEIVNDREASGLFVVSLDNRPGRRGAMRSVEHCVPSSGIVIPMLDRRFIDQTDLPVSQRVFPAHRKSLLLFRLRNV